MTPRQLGKVVVIGVIALMLLFAIVMLIFDVKTL